MKCWELRGCYEDAEMNGRCPHNIPGEPCPADCHFAACFRPTHVVCSKDVSVEAVNYTPRALAAGAARSIWRDTAPLWYWAPKRPCSPLIALSAARRFSCCAPSPARFVKRLGQALNRLAQGA